MENIVQATKQAAKPKKDAILDQPPSEKSLVLKERIANIFNVLLLLAGALLILIGTVQTVNTSFFSPSPIVAWIFFIPAMLVIGAGLWAGLVYSSRCHTLRRYYYQEIQGEEAVIDNLDFDNKSKHRDVRLAVVKGKNRMGGDAYKTIAVPARQVDKRQFYIGQKIKV